MRTWVVVYKDYLGPGEFEGVVRYLPDSRYIGDSCFVRVQEKWSGKNLKPPVGIRSDEASHRWQLVGDQCRKWELVETKR